MADREMTQTAPYPAPLAELLTQLRYKAGFRLSLASIDRGQGSEGLTLIINITGPDSYHPENTISVNHYFPVPPAAYDLRSWRRWLFDRLGDVDLHERCEWFQLVEQTPGGYVTLDGDHVEQRVERPYAPSHGPGNDPYLIREVGTDEDVRTSFRGELKT